MLGVVETSRHSAWGYDIRAEVAGAIGKVVIDGGRKTPVEYIRRVARDQSNQRVPRARCGYLAEMVGANLPDQLPEAYRDEAASRFGADLDPEMADDVVALATDHRGRVEGQVAAALDTLRHNLFPLHGLRA